MAGDALEESCIQKKGTGINAKHNSRKSVFHYLRFRWIHIIHPQKTQNVSVLLLYDCHEEDFLYVGNYCNWLDSESYENVKDVRS